MQIENSSREDRHIGNRSKLVKAYKKSSQVWSVWVESSQIWSNELESSLTVRFGGIYSQVRSTLVMFERVYNHV